MEHFDFAAAERYKEVLKEILFIINLDKIVIRKYTGVPFLSKHKLWVDYRKEPKLHGAIESILYNLDGRRSIFDLSENCGIDFRAVHNFVIRLRDAGLVELRPISGSWFSAENPFGKFASRELL